ncbi:MAG: MlaD family protein [Bryobacteraceae bacterium]
MPSAQKVQWAKIRITVLAVSSVSILAVLIYLLSGGTWLKPKVFLVTYVPDSTGLNVGSEVELNGVAIGQVVSLQLTKSPDPNRVVEVRMKVQQDFLPSIPDDSLTSLDSATMLGDQYVAISSGTSFKHILPNGELRFKPPTNLMKSIDLAQFAVQLRAIDQVIRDMQEGRGPLGDFMVSDALYRDFVDRVLGIEHSLRAATNQNSKLGQFLYSAETYNDIRKPLRELDDRLAQFQSAPLMRDSKQYDQIRDQIAQVRRSLAGLNAGKGAAGQFLVSDVAYTEWNRRLTSWIETVDSLNYGEGPGGRMLANAQVYESLNGALHSLQTTAKELREDPKKFLRVKIF